MSHRISEGTAPIVVVVVSYMEGYILMMTPIAGVIDFLKGERQMYFGYFIAALVSCRVKLGRLISNNELEDLSGVCSELRKGLLERFKIFFEGNVFI